MESGHPVIGRVKPRPTTIGIFLMVRSFLNDLVLFPGALPFLMFLTRSGTRQRAEEPSAVPHSTQVLAVTEDSLSSLLLPLAGQGHSRMSFCLSEVMLDVCYLLN